MNRRKFISNSSVALSSTLLGSTVLHGHPLATQNLLQQDTPLPSKALLPQAPKEDLLYACKLSMVKGSGNLTEKLKLVKAAGFNGIDFDGAGEYTIAQATQASIDSGLYIHNATNHAHWKLRFTDSDESKRKRALHNLEHCLRLSHACGGSGVMLVIGSGKDGKTKKISSRSQEWIAKALPLAKKLNQNISLENAWNEMFYQPGGPQDQTAHALTDYIDRFKSPYINSYFNIGNHHLYGHVPDWIELLGSRIKKIELKGYYKEKALKGKRKTYFCDITEGDIPWPSIRKSLQKINFKGWATAEVASGDLTRLKKILTDMKRALEG